MVSCDPQGIAIGVTYMGRMLQTMKQGDGRRALPASDAALPDAAVQDTVVDWEIAEEVPFVEVGGPNKKVELSPGLMAHPAQVNPRPPHQPVEIVVKPKAVQLTPAQPMAVAYEALTVASAVHGNVSTDIIAYHQPGHPTSKEYAHLLDTMLHSIKANGVLLLIGVKPNVGASTVLLNLATIAAQSKKLRVALVETNAKQTMAQRLGLTTGRGLDEVLTGALAMEQAIAKSAVASIHVLPAGNKGLVLTSEAIAWMCAWLRERYDLILIDGPTLEDTAALPVLLPHAHGVYLVLPQGDASGKVLAQSVSRLGGHVCGLIHTHFEM